MCSHGTLTLVSQVEVMDLVAQPPPQPPSSILTQILWGLMLHCCLDPDNRLYNYVSFS